MKTMDTGNMGQRMDELKSYIEDLQPGKKIKINMWEFFFKV